MKVIIGGATGTMGTVLIDLINNVHKDITIVAGVSKIAEKNFNFPLYNNFTDIEEKADIIIDFSHHSRTYDLVNYCRDSNTSVVIATTGHSQEELSIIKSLAENVGVLYSGNYSMGVNVLVELINKASKLLRDYDIEIIEKHHNKKVDAPSGTAKMLVNAVENNNNYSKVYGRVGDRKREEKEIGIHSVRGGTIVGEHTVIFAGEDEIIEIKHTALSKKMFAKGAIKGAYWLLNKNKGLYSMKDVLGLK